MNLPVGEDTVMGAIIAAGTGISHLVGNGVHGPEAVGAATLWAAGGAFTSTWLVKKMA